MQSISADKLRSLVGFGVVVTVVVDLPRPRGFNLQILFDPDVDAEAFATAEFIRLSESLF